MKTLFIFLSLFWQSTTSDPQVGPGEFIVFTQNEHFYLVTKEGFYKTTDGAEWFFLTSEIPLKDDFSYKSFELQGRAYIISAGLGEVYVFENNRLERIDNSFDFKAFFEASLFEHEDEIHAFGGYGLFTYKNTLLSFDHITKEWFLKVYTYEGTRPKERSQVLFQKKDSIFYMGMGQDYPASLGGDSYQKDFWKLDLTSYKWTYLGDYNETYVPSNFMKNAHKIKFFANHKPPLFVNSTKAIGVDILNNTLTTYEKPSVSLLQDIDYLYYNQTSGKFLMIHSNSSEDRKLSIKVLNSESFLGEPTLYAPLYLDPLALSNMEMVVLGVVILGLVVLFFFYMRNKNKRAGQSINIQELKDKLSKAEWDILDLILSNHPEPTSYPDILNSFEPNLTYESRIKKLRVSVENLNASLRTIYGPHKDYIVSQKNKDDKRVKEVRYNE